MTTSISRRKFLKLGLYGSLGCLAASYPFLIERKLLQVNEYNIPVRNLPAEFNGFRIAQLTDIHYGSFMTQKFLSEVINRANSLKADAIVCTGDYVTEGDNSNVIKTVWSHLNRLQAPAGVFSVLGNHDHWVQQSESLELLIKSGQSIRHKSVAILHRGKRLWIGGAGDFWTDSPEIDRTFRSTPEDECRILLAHNPDTADSRFSTRVDLVISGHTHGGQVKIPFVSPIVLPVQNKHFTSGLVQARKAAVFISKGIGSVMLPIRFNCYPEIAVLNLRQV
ncbi:MAG: metallophosphoesterase [Nitrospira sp.]|nr:metallophosphoesterase [Nitrospira sp.]